MRYFVFILGLLIFGIACNKQTIEPANTLSVEDYFPLDTGMYWIYDEKKLKLTHPSENLIRVISN